jgi:NurA domain
MTDSTVVTPFTDLPAALVDEVLQRTNAVGQKLLTSFEQIKRDRQVLRRQLEDNSLLCRDSDLGYPPVPTCCGVDGSYAVERLLATDLAAAAAVALEGLTPPSEKRFWDQPRHQVVVEPETHNEFTTSILRGLMIEMELMLATKAPHDVVFMDGSMTTPAIYLNQSLNRSTDAPALQISKHLRERAWDALKNYLEVLKSHRVDKCWVFSPKYSTRREIGTSLGWPSSYDDRGLLSILLQPGEYTAEKGLEPPESPWHITTAPIPEQQRAQAKELEGQIASELQKIAVIYYKPHAWTPALRLEVNRGVANNRDRLALLLHAIKHQCGSPAVLEPFPLYMADRMVKSLSRAVPAFRQATTQGIAETYSGSLDEVFYAMHGYRTDSGT